MSHSRTCATSHDECYPMPQVYLVDGGGGMQQSVQPPRLVPCWSFPPAQQRAKSNGKSRGAMGVSPCVSLVVLLIFLLVFAALGFEAYQINKMQAELREMQQAEPASEFVAAERQIGSYESGNADKKNTRTAAHLIGRIEHHEFPKTLRWESKVGQAFVMGEVKYQVTDGGLLVNRTGLYHIYTRVELIFNGCDLEPSYVHNVFVRRAGLSSPLTLMEARREIVCKHQHDQSQTMDSFLGATLKLQKHDRVYVNVSHPKCLSHAHYGNFFGLYEV